MKNKTKIAILCCAVYFVSYITRINYAAVLNEIIADLEITKSVASIAVTGSFVTYGLGQILSGFIGDKFKPQNVIFCGLLGTAFINLSVSFIPNINIINVIWCLNGFFQAMLWPPLVRIATENFEGKSYVTLIARISQSSYAATIFVYAFAPLVITFAKWQTLFLFTGSVAVIFGIIWFLTTKNIADKTPEVTKKSDENNSKLPLRQLISAGIIPIFIGIILQGFLRDGITTWTPTYITEVFNMDTSISIFTSAVLPLFSILSLSIVIKIANKFNNELKSSFVFFFASFFVSVGLAVMFSKFVVFDIAAMAIIISCMHGVNVMLIGNVPYHFGKFGKVSTVSGILNSATYVGSALSTFGFAAISDKMGWGFTIGVWVAISFIGAALCFIYIKKWKNFRTN